MRIQYFAASPVAGYSGFVLYGVSHEIPLNASYWMVPGTFFDDWDNR
jgi:hypothetical protein